MANCENCGTVLEGAIPGGLCPACLLGLARERGNRSGRRSLNPPPTPRELSHSIPGIEVLELLGCGGMGAVYRGRQTDLQRDVAVKILSNDLAADPTFVERFRREARALARLDHPNIVRVYESGVSGDLCYIVMEYVPGVSLREAIQERAVDPQAALRIVPQICSALEFAHSAGVVHRDIKPENILLGHGGTVKVADFGLAKLTGGDDAETLLTLTGTALGTMRYMAPEQFDGEQIDHRSDIYALGVVLYELLTGHVPMGHFPPASATPGVDPRVDSVVMRTLQREPGRRYQQASELRTDLFRISKQKVPRSPEKPAAAPASDPVIDPTAEGIRGHAGWAGAGQRPGRQWKTRARLFGLPLIHVAYGFDQRTGKKLVARGVLAIGDVAIGGIALGGITLGLLSVGGIAGGLTALGGLAAGLQMALGGVSAGGLAYGGVAIGVAAFGGAAVGCVAAGGAAIGYVALGGAAVGRYTWEQGRWSDPEFAQSTWLGDVIESPLLPYGLTLYMVLAILGPLGVCLLGMIGGWLVSRHRFPTPNRMPTDIKRTMLGHSLGLAGPLLAIVFLVAVPFRLFQAVRQANDARAAQHVAELQAESLRARAMLEQQRAEKLEESKSQTPREPRGDGNDAVD